MVSVAVVFRQDRQVTAGARRVSLVSGHSLYAMDDDGRFSRLANNTMQLSE